MRSLRREEGPFAHGFIGFRHPLFSMETSSGLVAGWFFWQRLHGWWLQTWRFLLLCFDSAETFFLQTHQCILNKKSIHSILAFSYFCKHACGKSIHGQLRDCYIFQHGQFRLRGQLWNVNKKSQRLPSMQKLNDISLCLLSLLNAPHKVYLPPRAGKQSRRRAFH